MSKLLVHRFGDLPAWTQERLSEVSLEPEGEQLFDAKSLEDLLEQNES